jgi:hypothetical protein
MLFFLTLVLAFVAFTPAYAQYCGNNNGTYTQTATNWNATYGSGWTSNGNYGTGTFVGSGSSGIGFTQDSTGGTSFVNNHGKAWGDSTQSYEGGTGAGFSLKLKNGQSGGGNANANLDFGGNIGNTSFVSGPRNRTFASSTANQVGFGSQDFGGGGFATGQSTVSMGGGGTQTFNGSAAASSLADGRNWSATGSGNQGYTGTMQFGMDVIATGPGTANGSFNTSQTGTITQTFTNFGTTSNGGRH